MNEVNFTKCKELICEYGGSEKRKKLNIIILYTY